jgi:hypothetical protein
MIMFPFHIGEVTSLYRRVLKSKDLSADVESEASELKDVVKISAAAKRQKILEETHSAVLSRVKAR